MSIDTTQPGNPGTVMDTIAGAVRALLSTDTITITESTRLVEDLGMDSSAVFGLLLELEDQLGIEIDTDVLQHLATVGTLADFVANCPPA